jgi:hypothetical protein
MSRPSDSPSLPGSIAAACRAPGVLLVYLFGSYARGTADAESDIDIAVLASPLSPEARRRLRLDLLARCTDILAAEERHIDLVILQDVPVLLQYNVVRSGILLAGNDADRIAYELQVERRYDDERPGLEEQTDLGLQRLLSHPA